MSDQTAIAAASRRRSPRTSGRDARSLGGRLASPRIDAPASTDETRQAETPAEVYRDADRMVGAAFGALTFGISPISLVQAWQDWAVHLAISPGRQQEILIKAMQKYSRFAAFLMACGMGQGRATPCISPLPQDRRFRHADWQTWPFNACQQSFLLCQQWWHNATTGFPGMTSKHEQLVEFYSRQLLDMLSPSNFALTNPEVLNKTLQSGGANLVAGARNWVHDVGQMLADRRSTEESAFRPGQEVAITPGDVVFRSDLIELIRYRPAGDAVGAQPVFIVPAWIMKYYILDLSPENSLVRYLVDQGRDVFCISWRNPGSAQREQSLEDYRRELMAAFDVVSEACGGNNVHGVGYCLGGTLLAIAAAAMAQAGDSRLQSLSLFAAQVDFEEPGGLGLFIDESQVTMLEDLMWQEGYLDQRRMAGAFQMLRSQDLVWSRLVHEYLMGERPAMSDLMAWNADATRMPYRMHSEYLRKLYLNNDLAQGRYKVDGRAIHIEDIDVPVFALGTVTDHVAPWRSVFKLTHLLETEIDFALTTGGHNAGVVSGPANDKRSYKWLHHARGQSHPDADVWVTQATEQQGSWWPAWSSWLKSHSSGETVAVSERKPLASLGQAPGAYVLAP